MVYVYTMIAGPEFRKRNTGECPAIGGDEMVIAEGVGCAAGTLRISASRFRDGCRGLPAGELRGMSGICIREEGGDKAAAVGPDRDRPRVFRGADRPGREGYPTPSFGIVCGNTCPDKLALAGGRPDYRRVLPCMQQVAGPVEVFAGIRCRQIIRLARSIGIQVLHEYLCPGKECPPGGICRGFGYPGAGGGTAGSPAARTFCSYGVRIWRPDRRGCRGRVSTAGNARAGDKQENKKKKRAQ